MHCVPWRYLLFLLFFLPGIIHGLKEKEAIERREEALSKWNQHNELIEQFKSKGGDEQNLQYLQASLHSCQRAAFLLRTLLYDLETQSKKRQKRSWSIAMKQACQEDRQTIHKEMVELQKAIDHFLSLIAFKKAQPLYDKSLEKAQLAVSKSQESSSRTLLHSDTVVCALQEVAKLYREAETLARQAHTLLSAAPVCDEKEKATLTQTIAKYQQEALSMEKEAKEWPEQAFAQKAALKERWITLTQDAQLLEEKGLRRSAYAWKKQALPILETLVQNSEAEERDLFQTSREALQESLLLFEEEADQKRITHTSLLPSEELHSQEMHRRKLFFNRDVILNPMRFLQEGVTPLDGQVRTSQKEFSLCTDQFYRFLIQSDEEISELSVQVFKEGELICVEKIALPIKNTLAWQSYLMREGMIFIPETKLTRDFGLDLRLSYTCDPTHHTSLILAQRSHDTDYQFSFSVNGEDPLYACKLLDPPPWQLRALCKPSLTTPHRVPYKNKDPFHLLPQNDLSGQVEENFPLLDKFVEQLKKDPLALASYVQNEIALLSPYSHQEEGVFQASGIQRNALRTYLEKQGSPWEQCGLLIYLLRKAGYQAFYAQGKPLILPKDFVEKMLLTRLPENQEEGLLQYPWVVFSEGGKWISLFPWMKEMQMHEGFNLYHFLPEEFASADRWIIHYLKGDERILKHIGPDGDESVAPLFVAFLEEHLRKQGLFLSDVGIERTPVKRQFTSFKEFPSPQIEGEFRIFDLDKGSPLFATALIEISSPDNPQKKLSFTLPFVSLTSQAIPLRWDKNRLLVHFIGEDQERFLDLEEKEESVTITVTHQIPVGSHLAEASRSIFLEKRAIAALCFHFGGATPQLTQLNYEQFTREQEEEQKLEKLLSFIGAAYFDKCGAAHERLAKLHTLHPLIDFAFGLAKFIDGEAATKLPQVDMVFHLADMQNSACWQKEIYSSFRQLEALLLVDISSNEHQILKDLFSDPSAISTVKLLQLAHTQQQKQGDAEEGFLSLSRQIFQEAEKSPEATQALYFSHLKAFNMRELSKTPQWKMASTFLAQEDPLSAFAYAYMTPGLIYSPDRTYQEMGTCIFHPHFGAALISSHTQLLNGGLGSALPEYYFSPSMVSQWQLIPHDKGHYKLEVPSSTTSSSLPEKTKWESDVRLGHKSLWNHVADPVDIVTGAFYIDEIDLLLPGPFPLEIGRNYNSQNPLMGELGAGWKLSFTPFLIEQEGKIYAAEADGTTLCYTYNPDYDRWEVLPEDNPELCLCHPQGGGKSANPFHAYIENEILYGSDGSQRFFEGGVLKKWVNAQGATLYFIYEEDRLSRIESSQGAFCGFEYHYGGKISEIYTKDGRRVSYSYNHRGDLVKVILPNNAEIHYEYDSAHRLFRETKPLGRVLENIYEGGKVVKQLSPMGPRQEMIPTAIFDYQEGLTTVTDAGGGKTLYKIFQNQIYQIIDPLGSETLQSWFITQDSWFDAERETIQPWEQPGGAARSLKSTRDKRGLISDYYYDNRGNVSSIIITGSDLTGDGTREILQRFIYNSDNLCIEEECLTQKMLTIYDTRFAYLPKRIEKYSENTLISYIDLEYNAFGQVEKEDNNGAITLLKYDTRGLPIHKTQLTGTDDEDLIVEYAYNDQGQCIKMIAADRIEENGYDIMGNLLQHQIFSPSGKLLSAQYIGYNLNNQPIWKQRANAEYLLYLDYHASGLLKAKREQVTPSRQLSCTLYEYDARGYLIEEVDPLGYTTYREYDALGRVITETKEEHTKRFTYEPGGLVTRVTQPSGATTSRHYTTNGLITEEIYPDGTHSSWIYDLFSRPILEIKKGIPWQTQYDDPHHQILHIHRETEEVEIRTYDARENLIAFTDRAGFVWEKTYDGLNRLTRERTPSGEETHWNYEGDSVTCHFPNGETEVTFYEGGRASLSERFDAHHHLISSYLYRYDPEIEVEQTLQGENLLSTTWKNSSGAPIQIQKGTTIERYEYDLCGNCLAIIDGEGRTTRQTFDGLKRLLQKELPDGSSLKFEYDLDSHLIKITFPQGNTWEASYDCMGRKSSEQLTAGREPSQAWEYTYIDGYLTKTRDPMGGEHAYLYDPQGRLLQISVEGWQKNYTYDPRGLLLSAEQTGKNASRVERAYDAEGRLCRERIHLNSELIQDTCQEWDASSRTLSIGNHRRRFHYQNNQLTQVTTGKIDLNYAYATSGLLESQTTPLSFTQRDYHASALPNSIFTDLPDGSYPERLRWDRSGKLSTYNSPLEEKQFTYFPSGHLESAGSEHYAEIRDSSSLFTSYNAAGEVVSQGSKSFTWDPWGKLLKVSDQESTWEAVYDALGRRLQTRYTAESQPTLIITSLYDPQEEFQEIGVRFQDKTFWKIYGPTSCDALLDEEGISLFLIHNALHQLVGIVTEQGTHYTPSVCSSYGPLNEPAIPSELYRNNLKNRFLTASGLSQNSHSHSGLAFRQWSLAPNVNSENPSCQNLDSSSCFGIFAYAVSLSWHSKALDPTGLILMGERYYSPSSGRFMSPDPLGYPLCIDLYAYANGDPINYMDLDGRFASYAYQFTQPQAIHATNNLAACCANLGFCKSESFKIGSTVQGNTAIGFINGIDNTRKEALESAALISKYAQNSKIHGIYNATNFSWLGWRPLSVTLDLVECIFGQIGVHTPPVQLLKNQWNHFINTYPPKAKFLQICHSGGARHVKNALLTSPVSVRQRIIALAIAPAAIIPRRLCFQSHNYISRNDFVTHLDVMGKMLYVDQLHILEPHPDADPSLDHTFSSPTFTETLQYHIGKYLKNYGGNE